MRYSLPWDEDDRKKRERAERLKNPPPPKPPLTPSERFAKERDRAYYASGYKEVRCLHPQAWFPLPHIMEAHSHLPGPFLMTFIKRHMFLKGIYITRPESNYRPLYPIVAVIPLFADYLYYQCAQDEQELRNFVIELAQITFQRKGEFKRKDIIQANKFIELWKFEPEIFKILRPILSLQEEMQRMRMAGRRYRQNKKFLRKHFLDGLKLSSS